MGVVGTLLVVLLSALATHASSNSPTIPFNPGDYQNTIYIDPSNSNSTDTPSCYKADNKQYPCADINFALAFPGRQQSTAFLLNPDTTHYLDNTNYTVFTESNHVAFIGDHGTAVVKCREGAGLAFLSCKNVTFIGVRFLYCGVWRDSTSIDFAAKELKFVPIRVGLYFYNCRDVTMTHMSVSNSTEALGVMMYSTAGVNYIGYSQFENNRISENNKNDSGGGGFAVEFNYCKPGDTNCSESNHQTENTHNSVYTMEHCDFINNYGINHSGDNDSDVSRLTRNQTSFSLGRGGGLSLFLSGIARSNKITINNCSFANNSAVWGGGLIIEFTDASIQNTVIVRDSEFSDNVCNGEAGGGARVSSIVSYGIKPNKTGNSVQFHGCTFTRNKALIGGAISFSYHLQPNSLKNQLFNVHVTECVFESNVARLGSAVIVEKNRFHSYGLLGEANFSACVFSSNMPILSESESVYSVGIGALFISEVHVSFSDYMNFHKNRGTALAIVGTTLTLNTNVSLHFENNEGSNGGALSLLGLATIVLWNNTSLTFKNNSASLYGGAIYNNYIGYEDLQSSVKCFLQYIDPFKHPNAWDTKFTFAGNKAAKFGHSIFSTTVIPCSWLKDIQTDVPSDVFCWNESKWVYENSTCYNQTATLPRMFNLTYAINDIFPGLAFQLNVTARDDLNNNVTIDTVYTASINSSAYRAQVDPRYAYVAHEFLSVTGEENQNITLKLNTVGARDWNIQLPLTLNKCPPGFKISNHSEAEIRTCECMSANGWPFGGNLYCDKEKMVSNITCGFWIGYITDVPGLSNDKLYMGPSPYIPTSSSMLTISQFEQQLDSSLCSRYNRTGQLCGECIEGFSTAVNSYSYKCVNCSSGDIFTNVLAYIGLTYLPCLVLLIVIIVLDIRLMSGPLIGFILYAQLVASGILNLDVDIPQNTLNIQKAYRIAYGVFNLNSYAIILDSFCVHDKFNTFHVICLDYGVAVFPLLLILIIRCLVSLRSIRMCKRRKNENFSVSRSVTQHDITKKPTSRPLIHTFVSFIYLSYTKLTLPTSRLLSTVTLTDVNGDYVQGVRLMNYAGHYYFGESQYILPFGLIAIVFLVVVVVLPLLLLGPLDFMNWLIDQPRFNFLGRYWPTLKINIFLDAFRGCYTIKCRYFAGIYFLFRLILIIINTFASDELLIRFWYSIFIVFLLILIAWKKPYKVKFLNYVDTLIFLNLAVINFFSIYLYTKNRTGLYSTNLEAYYGVCVCLIWLPMVYFLVYLCWLALHKTRRFRPLVRCLHCFFDERALREGQPLLNPARRGKMYTEISDDDDTNLFNRAEETKRAPSPRQIKSVNISAPTHIDGIADCSVSETNVTISSENSTNKSGSSASNTQPSTMRITGTE